MNCKDCFHGNSGKCTNIENSQYNKKIDDIRYCNIVGFVNGTIDEKIKETIEKLNILRFKTLDIEVSNIYLNAIKLFKKQMPIKPVYIDEDLSYFKCGICGSLIYYSDEMKSHKFCLHCGQKLDWN